MSTPEPSPQSPPNQALIVLGGVVLLMVFSLAGAVLAPSSTLSLMAGATAVALLADAIRRVTALWLPRGPSGPPEPPAATGPGQEPAS